MIYSRVLFFPKVYYTTVINCIFYWLIFISETVEGHDKWCAFLNGRHGNMAIDLTHKSQKAPVPYPTMLHSEQKCAHFCSEWSIVWYGTGAFWDLWNWSIGCRASRPCSRSRTVQWNFSDNLTCSWAMWHLLSNNSLQANDTIWRHKM